jgi:S-adenosylmethionine:tRNA ribosyltransferase-isomerase
MRTVDFDFVLPPELVAQHPAVERDQSRLLVLHRTSGKVEHRKFPDLLSFLKRGDVLVLNNSRVIPARLRGTNARTGGKFEILLLKENSTNDWWAMVRPGKNARVGTEIEIQSGKRESEKRKQIILATVVERNLEGHRRLKFSGVPNIADLLDEIGEMPLPPYIHRKLEKNSTEDRARYQTVFAQNAGSVAAPTAGLHFTPELLEKIRVLGVEIHFVTLHVGLGTFLPVKTEMLDGHKMHEERFEISETTARAVNEAKAEGRRVIAVGTTSVRVLESLAQDRAGSPLPADGAHAVTRSTNINAGVGQTSIFIYPPSDFKIVDALLTNFHVPRSTLVMLVSAFAAPNETRGREMILSAYAEAVRERYRFFSYGDAMLIL